MNNRNPNRLPRLLQVNVSRGSGDVPIWGRARLLLPGQAPEPIVQPRHSRPQRRRPGAPHGLPSEGVRPEANEYPNHLQLPGVGGFLGQPQGDQGAGEGGQQGLQVTQEANQIVQEDVQEPPQGTNEESVQEPAQVTSQETVQEPAQGTIEDFMQEAIQGTSQGFIVGSARVDQVVTRSSAQTARMRMVKEPTQSISRPSKKSAKKSARMVKPSTESARRLAGSNKDSGRVVKGRTKAGSGPSKKRSGNSKKESARVVNNPIREPGRVGKRQGRVVGESSQESAVEIAEPLEEPAGVAKVARAARGK